MVVVQVQMLLASLSDALDLTTLKQANLQRPSHAFRNRMDPGDPTAQIGSPGSHSEELTISCCIHELLSRLLALEQPPIQALVACIFLGMGPTPHVLQRTAQLLYNLSKNPENDGIFLQPGLVPRMLQCIVRAVCLPSSESKALDATLLLMGALKNATTCPLNRSLLSECGGITVIIRCLRICTGSSPSDTPVSGPLAVQDSSHTTIALQAIGILRNVAATEELSSKLMSSGILSVMRGVLVTASGCQDIVFGISRLLAKLSLCDDAVQEFLAEREALMAFVHAANMHATHSATALRFAFAFANFSERSSENAATLGAVRTCAF
jgi:hypothetical protein